MSTKQNLNKLADKIRMDFPDINRGGCCVFAALVAKALQHYYPTRVVAFNSSPQFSIDEVRAKVTKNSCKEWDRNGIDFNHIVIEFTDPDDGDKVYHLDANGVFIADGSISSYLTQVKGHLTIKEACEIASLPDGWNPEFNRNNIPKIDKIIKKHFGLPISNRWSISSIQRTASGALDRMVKEYYHEQLILS